MNPSPLKTSAPTHGELGAVDALSASAVVCGEVTTPAEERGKWCEQGNHVWNRLAAGQETTAASYPQNLKLSWLHHHHSLQHEVRDHPCKRGRQEEEGREC